MIKIAQSSYKKANQKGMLSSYLIWCRLKGYNSHGTVGRDKQNILSACDYLQISESNFRRHLAILVRSGLIIKNKFSYSLISYDKAWKLLGLNWEDSKGYQLRIFKFTKYDRLKEQVEFAEILLNTRLQSFKARKNLLKNSSLLTDVEKDSLKRCKFSELIEFLDDLYLEKYSILENYERFLEDIDVSEYKRAKAIEEVDFSKFTPFLTCLGISSILGYKSNTRTGQNVRKRIQEVGLARFTTRKVDLKSKFGKHSEFVKSYFLKKKYPNRFKIGEFFGIQTTLISRMDVLI